MSVTIKVVDGVGQLAVPVYNTRTEWAAVRDLIRPDIALGDDEAAEAYLARTGLNPEDPTDRLVIAIVEAAAEPEKEESDGT